jgi:anti-anti-sigma factor
MDLNIVSTVSESTVVVRVIGEIDISNVLELRAALKSAAAAGPATVGIDLSEVAYMGAAGISALEHGRTLAADAGADFRILAVSDVVALVLRVGLAADLLPEPTPLPGRRGRRVGTRLPWVEETGQVGALHKV